MSMSAVVSDGSGKPSVAFTGDSIFDVPDGLSISEVSLSTSFDGILNVTISGQEYEYPIMWLRFRCVCSECMNHDTLSYPVLMESVVYGSNTIKTVKPIKDGKAVECVWDDEHVSVYTAEWLYIRRFSKDGLRDRNEALYFHRPQEWLDKVTIERGTYEEITTIDSIFEHFAECLIRDGIFIITGAPDRYVSEEFGEKIGNPVYPTHYGKDFTVVNLATPNNLAYTSAKLELHIDQPFIAYCPQIQLLHCLSPADQGGENIMADGIKAANLLRKRHPEHYRTLRDVKIAHEDIIALPGHTHQYIINNKPVINENEAGEVEYLQYNGSVLSSLFNSSSVTECTRWMEAMKEFYKIYRNECSVTVKCEAGDILVFDNQRVMHAREPFSTKHTRRLEGFYINWDYIHSRLRVAKIHQRMKKEENRTPGKANW